MIAQQERDLDGTVELLEGDGKTGIRLHAGDGQWLDLSDMDEDTLDCVLLLLDLLRDSRFTGEDLKMKVDAITEAGEGPRGVAMWLRGLIAGTVRVDADWLRGPEPEEETAGASDA